MAVHPSASADKIIVDRTKVQRNSDVAKAVRRTRDRLAEQTGSPALQRELLRLHARSILSSVLVMPLFILAIAAGGLWLGIGYEILGWASVSILLYSGLAVVAQRLEARDTSSINPQNSSRLFLLAHAASGAGWIALALIGCVTCGIDYFFAIKAVIMLIAVAATAIIAPALRGALIATFLLPFAIYGIIAVDSGSMINIAMAGLLIVSLPFFTHISSHFSNSALMFMSFRSEKDSLIAELETAKSISDEARRRAEEANLAKSRFLASMSHELRTPLNAILGFSEVMAGEVLGPMSNPTYRGYATDIHVSGTHLLHLINEILDLSRIEAGRYHLNEDAISLAQVVEDCCRLMELRTSNKDIRIIQQFEQDMPKLYADERSIRQISLNLLSNAVKFTPSGGEIRVRVGWTAGGGQYLSIKDNGPGIAAEEIPIVLSAFGQGAIAIKNAEQGTGLGLPIVQGLVDVHDGTFELRSRLREGTEAIAIFPATRVMVGIPDAEFFAATGTQV